MKYQFNFDDNGKFQGWQDVTYELECIETLRITESQFWFNGKFQFGHAYIWDTKSSTSSVITTSAWGNMDIVRDAVEKFCDGTLEYVVIERHGSEYILPVTEESMVL
jgi:hypothetical protein